MPYQTNDFYEQVTRILHNLLDKVKGLKADIESIKTNTSSSDKIIEKMSEKILSLDSDHSKLLEVLSVIRNSVDNPDSKELMKELNKNVFQATEFLKTMSKVNYTEDDYGRLGRHYTDTKNINTKLESFINRFDFEDGQDKVEKIPVPMILNAVIDVANLIKQIRYWLAAVILAIAISQSKFLTAISSFFGK